MPSWYRRSDGSGTPTCRCMAPDANAPCPLNRVNRHFKADRPNQLWVSDFTYVSTWQGWLYVAFITDVYARESWAGGSAGPCRQTLFWTHWSRYCMTDNPTEIRSFITRIAEPSTSAFAKPSDWPRRVSNPRWAVAATVATMPWPRRSTGCTKPS